MICGEAGFDILRGGFGADFLFGGAGIDWVYYDDFPTGVFVDLADLFLGPGGTAEGDNLTAADIENVLGSPLPTFYSATTSTTSSIPTFPAHAVDRSSSTERGSFGDILRLNYSSVSRPISARASWADSITTASTMTALAKAASRA